ncbi:MAG TPA: hypothetical protein VH025_10020 [Solirubrobacteraceae bacterium]|jgi:hypothetical protein|nr:hypothetical protein [Solirubrobacteraceae bacterium]
MNGIFFYIGLGAGLAAACGLRPFLPVLLAGALASASVLGVSFAYDPFRFAQEDWWLLVVAVALVVVYAVQLLLGMSALPDSDGERSGAQPLAATIAGLGYGAGAVLFAGTLAAHHDAWWPGLLGGLAVVWLTQRAVLPIFSRARARLADGTAKQALTVYLDAVSLVLALLVSLLHPLGYVALALLVWLALRGRARGDEKYAGLRVLRR